MTGKWVNTFMFQIDPVKFRNLRRSWFMSQQEFCELTGLNGSTVSDLENGKRKHGVRGSTLRRIMKATGCEANDLLTVARPSLVRENEVPFSSTG